MKHHIRFAAHAAMALTAVTAIALLVSVASMGSAAEEGESVELGVQLYAAPLQVVRGEKIRLDWESEDADYCTASGSWAGKKESAGSVWVVGKKKIEVFTLQCFDDEGNASKKITQKVVGAANKKALKRSKLSPPTPRLTAPSRASKGGRVTISWSTPKGTIACRASGPEGWEGLKRPNGSDEVEAQLGQDYRLLCWNENGQEATAGHVFKEKPHRYSAADVGLSADYVPMYPDDAFMADGTEVYFIDFVRKDERSADTDKDDLFYWGKRIVIDPDTNLLVEDKNILKELFALPGQVPPDVVVSSKLIKPTVALGEHTVDDAERFRNAGEDSHSGEIPTLSLNDAEAIAIDYTLTYLDLPREDEYRKLYDATPLAIWFNGRVAGPPMYFAFDVYNKDEEKVKTIVMDPYTGEKSDDETVEDMFENGVWDRSVMKVRIAEEFQKEPPVVIKGEPVSNPPEQKPVTPIPEVKKEEPKKEEPKTSTPCPSGFVWSQTLQKCYEEEKPKQDSGTKKDCASGYSYSITFGQCVKD